MSIYCNKILYNLSWSTLFLAMILLCSCSTTGGIEATGKTTWNAEGAPETNKRIIIQNDKLAGNIEITDIKTGSVGDMMKVQASLRSKSDSEFQILYKFEWADSQGMEIGSSSVAWKPLFVYSKESRTIQGIAPDPRASEFKLKIREADSYQQD